MIPRFFLLLFVLVSTGQPVFATEFTKEEVERIKIESLKNMPERLKSTPEEKAKFVVENFERVCFSRFFDPQKIIDFADTFYSAVPEDRASLYRYNFQAQKGPVWWGAFPEGRIAVVYDTDTHSCNVSGYDGDREAFHKEVEKMSARAAEALPQTNVHYSFSVDEHSGFKRSMIQVSFKDQRPYDILVTGDTPIQEAPGPLFLTTIQAIRKQ